MDAVDIDQKVLSCRQQDLRYKKKKNPRIGFEPMTPFAANGA